MVLPPIDDRHRPTDDTESDGFDGTRAASAMTDGGGGSSAGRRVTFIEGMPRTVRCVAVGGYPLPEMVVRLGSEDITSRFTLSYSVTMEGVRGLRIIRYRTERRSDVIMVSAGDDERSIRCVAAVPGLGSLEAHVGIHVICKSTMFLPSLRW